MRFITVLVMLLIVTSCDESDKLYEYSGFDSTGAKIVTGWLLFERWDSTAIEGEWSFTAVGQAQNIGPQQGSGILRGGYDSTAVWINLNPGWADNNVFLSGIVRGNKISGIWTYSSFFGVVNQGSFRAAR